MSERRRSLRVLIPAPPERADRAVLRALQTEHPQVSRASLKRWFAEGRVSSNGRPLAPALELTQSEAEIEILDFDRLIEPRAAQAAEHAFLPVLYEDSSLLVLDKRSGTASSPLSPDERGTAVGSALAHLPSLASVGDPMEPGLLHRLDTSTSGCLAFAKTDAAFARLKAAWQEREIRKVYRAVVSRSPRFSLELRAPMRIEYPLGHDHDSSRRMRAVIPGMQPPRIRGKPLPALTAILSERPITGGKFVDLEIEIATGVMHQIRAHLAAIGWPIVGDTTYGGAPGARLWLHAWKLELPDATGSRIEVEAPLPEGWPG